MPNPSTYPYRRFPTIQVGAADHAARGTDAVKQELHALCAGSSKTVVTVECYPGTDQAEIYKTEKSSILSEIIGAVEQSISDLIAYLHPAAA